MLKIRLSRVGRKHEPVYRLILVESTEPAKTGKAIEVLGNYDSRNGEKAEFNGERIVYWISKGAQVSDTAHNLLLKRGLIKGERRNVVAPKVFAAAKAKIVEAAAAKEAEAKAAKEAEEAAKKAAAEAKAAEEAAAAAAPVETPSEEAPIETPTETPAENAAVVE